ncbi:hypothetical protein C8F01DRAFT_1190241 [Mycena amicta]|nr:hypothetical protein C8F01DRAFT_1190241 [Mycena amicta]
MSTEPELSIEAATQLTFQDYLVYVPGTSDLPDDNLEYRSEDVEFVTLGLPRDVPDRCIESTMSIPIFPATEHLAQRHPLHPLGRFPWLDAYLSPFLSATVRCRTLFVDDPILCKFSIRDRVRHDRLFSEDRERQAGLWSAFHTIRPDDDTLSIASTRNLEDGLEETSAAALFEFANPDNSESDANPAQLRRQPGETELQNLRAMISSTEDSEPPEDMLTVTFTHDISRLKELACPRDFYIERDNIARIAQESVARKRKAAEDDAAGLDSLMARYLAEKNTSISRSASLQRRTNSEVRATLTNLSRRVKQFLCHILRISD